MLYECTECKHQISSDAWRCPNCGCKDAGSLAEAVYLEHQKFLREIVIEREKDRTDPGWRQREAEERAARYREHAEITRRIDATNKATNPAIMLSLVGFLLMIPMGIKSCIGMMDSPMGLLYIFNWFGGIVLFFAIPCIGAFVVFFVARALFKAQYLNKR